MKSGKGYSKKVKWTSVELDNFYNASITERKAIETLLPLSSKNRSYNAITTKMYKVFGTSVRVAKDGLHYLWLENEVPNRIRRRRTKAVEATEATKAVESIVEPTSEKVPSIEELKELQNHLLRENYNLEIKITECRALLKLNTDYINQATSFIKLQKEVA